MRRPILDALYWGIPRAMNRSRASEVASAIRCHVTGRSDGGFDVYELEFVRGAWRASRGTSGRDADLTVIVDAAELIRLASGGSDPLEAYHAGKLQVTGNVMLAARLTMVLRGAWEAAPS